MKRFNVRLEDDMAQKISEIEQETGKPQSEIIRRLMQLGLEHWHLKQQYGNPKPFGKGSLMEAQIQSINATIQTLLLVRNLVDEKIGKKIRADVDAQLATLWCHGKED